MDTTPNELTFRVFVSSTFTDFAAEREALQERVFPRLREHCLAAGARFQAVDLRWGIGEEAAYDQRTMSICLDEIARCQQVSPRPNFLVLLGDRYGWCPLPVEFSEDDFQEIRAHATAADAELLDEWYWRDANGVPPVYELRRREGEWRDPGQWAPIETRLRAVLRASLEDLSLPHERRIQYTASATEQEIFHGALTLAEAAEHVHCFFRSIDGLPGDERATGFVDLHRGRPDPECQQRLRELKHSLELRLPKNVYRYREEWTGNGITHDGLEALCAEVERRLREVIDARIVEVLPGERGNEERHRHLAAERAGQLQGRRQEIGRIEDYVHGSHPGPLIVSGPAGCGKSVLLGHVAGRVKASLPAGEVVARFVGADPSSSDPRALVESIYREVGRILQRPKPSDTRTWTLGRLADELRERLGRVRPERPLILFLDGLDQLAGPLATEFGWLPRVLPGGVRLVLSTRSPADLEGTIGASANISLGPLQFGDAEEMLDQRLAAAGRTLRPEQRSAVLRSLAANALPVHVRFVADAARRWKSHGPVVNVPATAEVAVRAEFARLSSEENHGAMLVGRSLSCLAAARSGLAEDEILDLLSTEEVMADFARRSPNSPPVQSLPPVVWARLHADLAPYLDERVAEGIRLITFHDPIVRDVVAADYLPGQARVRRHAELADYFRAQRLNLRPPGVKFPIANTRVLRQLPWHLLQGARYAELAELLTDFQFIDNAENAQCAGEILPYLTELKSRVPLLKYFARAFERLGGGNSDHGIEFVAPGVALFHEPAEATELTFRRINDVVIRYLRPLFEPRELVPFMERAVDLAAQRGGPHAQALRNNLATLLLEAGDNTGARALYASATPTQGAWTYANALHGQGVVALEEGNLDAAEQALREALRLHKSVPGPLAPGVADDLEGLGAVAEKRGRPEEARDLYQQALEAVEHWLGTTHPRALEVHRRLAWICRKKDDLDEALQHYRWVIRSGRVSLGARHRQVQQDRLFLGITLSSAGRLGEAWRVLREIWDLDPCALNKSGPPSKAEVFMGVAKVLRSEKRDNEAEAVLWHALESAERDPQATEARRVACMEPLLLLLAEEQRFEESLPLMRRGLTWAVQQFGYDSEEAIARRRRVSAVKDVMDLAGRASHTPEVECVFCGSAGPVQLAAMAASGDDEYECSSCSGVLHWPSLSNQRERELIASDAQFATEEGRWFGSRRLPFPYYIRTQCRKCGYEATYYTRRERTGPGTSCPKCGYADHPPPAVATPRASSERPYWEAWGTFKGTISSWCVTCDRCGHDDRGDFHDRPEHKCPGCGYGADRLG